MKLIIAGSRNTPPYDALTEVWSSLNYNLITEIVSGGARGADKLGEQYAANHNIPVKVFKPKWHEFGRRAGIVRNAEMVEYGDSLLAIWDGVSKGTKFTIDQAKKKGIPVTVFEFKHEDYKKWEKVKEQIFTEAALGI